MVTMQFASIGKVLLSRVQSWLQQVYGAIILCFFLTFLAGAFFLTVEPDEVWILMSTMKAFGLPIPQTSAVNHPVTTTGGAHLMLHGLISLVRPGDILIHRFATLAVTAVLFGFVFKLLESFAKDRKLAAAGTALFATAPGFLLQASLATSEILATTLFLLAAVFWVRLGTRSAHMAVAGGILFGLACATRMTCLSMLPAILVWSAVADRGWIERLIYPVIAIAVAILVFLGFVAFYVHAFADTPWRETLSATASATGVGQAYPGLLLRMNYVVVSDGIVPILGIVALIGCYISRWCEKDDHGEITRLCGFLLLAGLAGWLAWVLKAPIAHIRYLWPAIPFFWLSAILLWLAAFRRERRDRTVAIVHFVLIAMCASQGLLNIRTLAVGDSLALVYETARETELGTPRAFSEAHTNQARMVELVNRLPASSKIYALAEPAAYPITYLSGRTIRAFAPQAPTSGEDYLLVLPSDYSIWRPRWDWIGWLEDNATLIERHGLHALYRIAPDGDHSAR